MARAQGLQMLGTRVTFGFLLLWCQHAHGFAIRPTTPVMLPKLRTGMIPPHVASMAADEAKPKPKLPPPDADPPCIDAETVETCTLLSWDAGEISLSKTKFDKLVLAALLTAWYVLNVGYNITLKRAQNAFPMPWTMSVASLLVGVPFISLLWLSGLRKPPSIDRAGVRSLVPIGAAHALGHAGAVISIGAGAVSFAHTVKAAEPLFTCVLSYLILGTVFRWQVYASLLPIIGGVSLASLKELSFTWRALWGAVTSNLAFATRAVLSKATMEDAEAPANSLSAPNLYGVLTIIATALSLPVALYYEASTLRPAWRTATAAVGTPWLLKTIIANGLFFYGYNEVAFVTLSRVSPVTHSIANTFKRVVIILATVLVFGNRLTPLGALGAAMAVVGTLGYSVAKRRYA